MPATLLDYLSASASRRPAHTAAEEATEGSITYAELDALSDRVRDRLRHLGVQRGDRVGVYLPKSIDALAVILGVMKAGAAYVPVDAEGPHWRTAFILHDCQVRVAFLEARQLARWAEETEKLGARPATVVLDGTGAGRPLLATLDDAQRSDPAPVARTEPLVGRDLAYLLYTSGSTGKPKGVMLTHAAALGFVEWCSRTFQPHQDDRFSSHAPFHFDLSILDLYLPMKHGATVVLIGSAQGREPTGLAALIAARKLTIWYSTPTVLTLLAQYGKLDRHDLSALRIVFFAGEVFPVKHLRLVTSMLSWAKFYNLYGPTETNVCAWYPIPDRIPEDRDTPFPIGYVCDHLSARIVDEHDAAVKVGDEGELCIAGDNVLTGYWNLPERNAIAFLTEPDGTKFYRTGDIVVDDGSGCLDFIGRRDRMVKRRGYRIELGEIEAGLYRHPHITEVAVVSVKDREGGVRIRAFVACADGARPSLVELKNFSVEVLAPQMIPDDFVVRDTLPKTSTDKIDYQRLMADV
ncbi:MAG TPA: amino acid adenylation domain-containing protein [Gemmatimonadaceae bacterium]